MITPMYSKVNTPISKLFALYTVKIFTPLRGLLSIANTLVPQKKRTHKAPVRRVYSITNTLVPPKKTQEHPSTGCFVDY